MMRKFFSWIFPKNRYTIKCPIEELQAVGKYLLDTNQLKKVYGVEKVKYGRFGKPLYIVYFNQNENRSCWVRGEYNGIKIHVRPFHDT